MNSLISKLLILLALTAIVSTEALAAKGSSGGTTTPVVEPDKAAKKTDRIELLAKMKEADPADAEVESENEASLKYRSRGTKLKLTAEVEGFTDGDILKMYVVINNAEVLVASLELVGEGEAIPRQEIEFDETTWPTGVPKVLTAGTLVKLRDSKGVLVLESSLQPK